MIAGLIALMFSIRFPNVVSYWVILMAVLMSQSQEIFFFWKNIKSTLWVTLFILLNVFITNAIALSQPYLIPVYLAWTTFLTVGFGLVRRDLFFKLFLINLFGILSAGNAVSGYQLAFRFEYLVLGVIIVILVDCILYPFLPDYFNKQFSKTLSGLNDLQKKIFSIYCRQDYFEKLFSYEKELHHLRKNIFDLLIKLRKSLKWLPESKRERAVLELDLIEQMSELIISIGQLRFRVKDHATFAVCETELTVLAQQIELMLRRLSRNDEVGNDESMAEKLTVAIQTFEEINRSTLQVVSHSPLAFLIFIQDMYAVRDLMEKLNRVLHDEK